MKWKPFFSLTACKKCFNRNVFTQLDYKCFLCSYTKVDCISFHEYYFFFLRRVTNARNVLLELKHQLVQWLQNHKPVTCYVSAGDFKTPKPFVPNFFYFFRWNHMVCSYLLNKVIKKTFIFLTFFSFQIRIILSCYCYRHSRPGWMWLWADWSSGFKYSHSLTYLFFYSSKDY